MAGEDTRWRRELTRELTRRARASAREAAGAPLYFGGRTRRIGITGPPGAGKSSLIALLAKHWAAAGGKLGIIAIDPTSPVAGGSLLGDRIRMDEVAQDPNLFIRSLSSGSACDGLCPNISSLLEVFEQSGFEHLILETVGVGQVSYSARCLVDTFVLVLVPDSGDTIQAMKAGILETADVYVVNKADLPTAVKLAAELRSIAAWRGKGGAWTPPVILTSAIEGRGATELAAAIEAHRAASLEEPRRRELTAARREYHLRSLVLGHLDETLAECRSELQHLPPAAGVRLILDRLRDALAC